MLWAGDDAIGVIPEDRWAAVTFDGTPPASGRSYTRAAGVLDNIWDFDAAFFGISAREAAQMDPQQRLMLELAWEALEDAGLPGGAYRRDPDDQSGPGRTGVYIGAASMDHAQRFASDAAGIDSPFMTGNTLSIIANRISHFFDFQGPSLTIDTACASSMTALHLAAGALERGEIDTAVVGGVNLLLQPFNFVGFSRAGMLSPSGRCRPFDAAADGYVRGEGGVVIVLRRLDAALGGGEPVQAVLAASGIGTDGHKVGLTRPAVAAQASLIAAVHEAAALAPGALAFVEAHGTGTPTGDPVEAAAIATALGPEREGLAPLPIGSIKGAIGHLEPAAGLAGLLKAVLSLREGKLPASPHVNTVNPAVAAEEAVTVALANAPLMHATGTVPAAGVSSFGFGGANAHVVLRAPAPGELAPAISPGTASSHLPALTLSAATEDALAALAARWQGQAAGSGAAQTAARRTLMAERAVIAAQTTETQAVALDALSGGRSHPALTRCRALPPDRAGIAFFYAGNGGQWAGMGERLLADDAAARRGFSQARDALVAAGGPDAKALMANPALEALLADSVAAQTLLFAQQVATTVALRQAGLTPALVAGHSVGEVTAAWAAGCLDLAAAARLIVGRATAIEPLRDSGTMAALLSDAETALSLIEAAGLAREVCLAAENSQRSVTLSGTREGIETLARVARERRLALRRLPVAYPYHAAPLEQVEQAMRETFAGISGRAGTIPLASTVTGGLIEGTALDEAHWWANARRPVRFRAVVEGAAASGCGFFVEIGPRPILSSYIRDTLGEAAEDAIITATENAPSTRTGSRGTAEDGGAAPAAQRIAALARATEAKGTAAAPLGPAVAGLPRYPWQRNHHRAAPSATAIDLFGVDCKDALIRPRTPLLGGRDRAGEGAWHGTADVTQTPWLAEHRIAGHCLAPAALFAALAIEALHRESPPRAAGVAPAVELIDLAIDAPLALLDERAIALRTQLDREGRQILISAAGGMGGAWQTHARARFRQPAAPIEGRDYAADAGSTAQPHTALAHELYAALERHGLAYGPAFRRLTEIEVSA
ncbi:MAG: type I polyketide synthase, partial [Pseudomonadota bacterium]